MNILVIYGIVGCILLLIYVSNMKDDHVPVYLCLTVRNQLIHSFLNPKPVHVCIPSSLPSFFYINTY